jgi:hypothetical protein
MGLGSEQTDRGLAALVVRLTDGFSRLVTQHLELARVELAEDARTVGRDVAWIAAGVPFVLLGYAFLCGALAVVLAQWVGWAGGLALVGAVNVAGGGVGVALAVARLKERRLMDDTAQELGHTVAVLSAPSEPVALTQESPHGR